MSGRRRSTRRLKLTLAALIALGGASFLGVSGTLAIFTAQETNAGNTVTAGSLLLTNTIGATSCSSNGSGSSGNVNSACTALMTSGTLEYPGQSATASITLSDTGTLPGTALSVYMPTCTSTTSPSAGTHAGGGAACTAITDSGTADGLQFVIQETNSGGTATQCWYPVNATGTCSAASSYATSVLNSFGNFAQNLNSTAHVLSLGAGPTTATPRYFQVSVLTPTNASNSLQGEEALFGLTWHLTD